MAASPSGSVSPNAAQATLAPIGIGWPVLGPAISFCSFAFLVVFARWHTRIFIARAAGPEDLLISLAMVRPAMCLHSVGMILTEEKMLMIAHTITIGIRMSCIRVGTNW